MTLNGTEVFEVVVRHKADFQGTGQLDSSRSWDDCCKHKWLMSNQGGWVSVRRLYSNRLLYDLNSVQLLQFVQSTQHGSPSESVWYSQPTVEFVFSSFEWEILYKICAILFLIYPKCFKNLENSQNVMFSKILDFFSKLQQIFKTGQFFFKIS